MCIIDSVDGGTFLLNGDGVLSDLVATDLVEDVDVVLTGVGVVVDENEEERLIVDEGLRSCLLYTSENQEAYRRYWRFVASKHRQAF